MSALSCAQYDGRLVGAPGLSLGAASERCGDSLDSYAYMADNDTVLVTFNPHTRDRDLRAALDRTVVELTLPGNIDPGTVFVVPQGKVSEQNERGIAEVTAVVTGGSVLVEDVKWSDGHPVTMDLVWNLTFGDENREGTWLHAEGRDTLQVSNAYLSDI